MTILDLMERGLMEYKAQKFGLTFKEIQELDDTELAKFIKLKEAEFALRGGNKK